MINTDPFLYAIAVKRAKELTSSEAAIEPLHPDDLDEVIEGVYADLISDSADQKPQT